MRAPSARTGRRCPPPTTRESIGGCCRRLARAATFAGDYATAAEALEGLEPDGSADDAALLLARGILAYFTGDL